MRGRKYALELGKRKDGELHGAEKNAVLAVWHPAILLHGIAVGCSYAGCEAQQIQFDADQREKHLFKRYRHKDQTCLVNF